MKINERIKLCRENMNMSQEELAQKMGYKSKSTISKIESGLRDVKQSKVIEFAKVLNTTTSYLMGWEESDSQTPPAPKTINDIDFTGIERIAAEHKGENFTQDELKFIQDTIDFVVAKKRKSNKKDGQPND